MAWLDGAVNGMVSRLIPVGYTPDEAFCLAQAAYIKESKRAKGVPRSVVERQLVSMEINQTLNRLGPFPMGPEAHRQRIILWERVFGRGSWHEPIDPEEIYGPEESQPTRSVMDSLNLQRVADDAAFSKLYYVAPDAGSSPLELLNRGFQVIAGGNSALCAFKIRGDTDQHDGLIACTADKIGLFTIQSLAASGDPIPGDRIKQFSSIRSVAYATLPGAATIPNLGCFTAADAPHPVMMIRFDNDEVWDLRFSTGPVVGHRHVPYENFVKGFHADYKKWDGLNQQSARAAEVVQETRPAINMGTSRSGHTATLLLTGKVFVAGGGGESVLSGTELYDPSTGEWQNAATMHVARTDHTATLLPDGTVLIAGGKNDNWDPLASAERFDPETGTWVETSSMATARESHTATLLPNGSILVAGGYSDYGTSDTVEIFDPATGEWSITERLGFPRYGHSATLLDNGAVLVCGGQNGDDWHDSCELYDTANGTWSTTGAMSDSHAHHTATVLTDGKILITGGSIAELYDPVTATWSSTSSPGASRSGHTATLLPNGTVVVLGGTMPKTLGQPNSDYGVGSAEIYSPMLDVWTPPTAMEALRVNHTATLLADGTVIACGGYNWRTEIASVEFWG